MYLRAPEVRLLVWSLPVWSLSGALASQLPVLRSQIPPAYPERALERAIEGDVRLAISIEDDGRVVGVELLEPAGHGFDAPAVEAAWSMVFDPALDDDGRPSAAVIEWVTTYRMSAVPPLSIEGVVREKGEKKKNLADVRIEARGPDEVVARTRSDDTGHFRFAALPPGDWTLTVKGPGLVPSSSGLTLGPDDYVDGIALNVEFQPEYEEGAPIFDEYVEVTSTLESEPAERVIDHDLVVRLPGSFGDPIRALQNLPGVARAPFGSGQLLVRGNDASDTGYFLDGMRIPLAFHFTAVSTVVAADLLKQVEMIPGGYGVRYGSALGGVVDLATTSDLPRKGTTSASADVFQASVFTNQRLGKNTALVLSARRSYADLVLQPILEGFGAGAIRVPRYYDAQLHLVQRVAKADRLTLTMLLSEDRFRLIADSGIDAITYKTGFQKFQLRYQGNHGRWHDETTIAGGPETQEIVISGEEADLGQFGVPVQLFGNRSGTLREQAPFRLGLRQELLLDPADRWFGIRLGADGTFGRQTLLYTIQEEPEYEERGISLAGLYGEPTVRLGPLDLIPGVRANLLGIAFAPWRVAVDPRFRTTLDLGQTTILANAGWYSQTPAMRELIDPLGATLRYERSFTTALGVKYDLGDRGELGATAYRLNLWDLVVGRDEVFRFDQTSLDPGDDFGEYANDGVGNATGLELFARWANDVRLLWASVSISRAFRQNRPEFEVRPSDADQPVNVVLIASQAVSRKTRFGARGRFASGPAMTPILGGLYATDLGVWLPIEGEPWSDRSPSFFSLDVRMDYDVKVKKSEISLYTEVQNVTNQRNVEIPAYTEDFSEFRPTYGLPVFPAFGLKVIF